MNVYYVNHLNEKIDLNSDNIFLQYQEFFDYSWDATMRNNKISGFTRLEATIPVTVAVTADTWTEYLIIANNFYQIIEKDILAKIPGKLYVGEFYIPCYIAGDKKTDAFMGVPFQAKNLSIVTDYPFWCRDKTCHFYTNPDAIMDDGGKTDIDNTLFPYTHIRYALDSTGLGMTDKPDNIIYGETTQKGEGTPALTNVRELSGISSSALPQTLYSLPNGVKDEYNIASGKGVQRIGRVVLGDTDVPITQEGTGTAGKYRFMAVPKFPSAKATAGADKQIVSDKVASGIADATYNLVVCVTVSMNDNGAIFCYLEETSEMTLSDAKIWFSNNPITVLYELATPIEFTGAIGVMPYIGIATTDSAVAPTDPKFYRWRKYEGYIPDPTKIPEYPRDYPYGYILRYRPPIKRNNIRDYPYDYYKNHTVGRLDNDHFAESDFRMIVYGPCTHPEIRIGPNLYRVSTTLYDNEYLVIDSRERTIVKYGINGVQTNLFNMRDKEFYIFQKIPAGKQTVRWNAQYSFDVVLYQERSEPLWSMS